MNSNNNIRINPYLLSSESLNQLLVDFGIIPSIIDTQNVLRIFRSIKLWESLLLEAISSDEDHTTHNSINHSLTQSPDNSVLKLPNTLRVSQ